MSAPIHLFTDICKALSRYPSMKSADRKTAVVRDAFKALEDQATHLAPFVCSAQNHHKALWSAATSLSLCVIEALPEKPSDVFEIMTPKATIDVWARHVTVEQLGALQKRGLSMSAALDFLTIRAMRGKDTQDLQDWVLKYRASNTLDLKNMSAFTAQNIGCAPDFTAQWIRSAVEINQSLASHMLDQSAGTENGLHFILLEKAGAQMPHDPTGRSKRLTQDLTNHQRITHPAFRHGSDIAAFCRDKEAIASARGLFKKAKT